MILIIVKFVFQKRDYMVFYSGDFPHPLSPDEPEFVALFPELSQTSRRALLMEQLTIERQVCLQEIADLRQLLQLNDIDDSVITNWQQRSDTILDRLIRYGKGVCGKHSMERTLFRPWGWRRRCRNHFS
jgi:hypothetical protein